MSCLAKRCLSAYLLSTECDILFASLLPQGFAGPDVLGEIAPEGWEASPLLAVFHPSLDQVYEEAVRMHRNLQSFPWRTKEHPPEPEPTREAIASEYRPTPVETEREVGELVGRCLSLVDMRPLSEALRTDAESHETEDLLPSDDETREHDLADLQTSLDAAHREAVEEALDRPLPATVLAYESVYGRLPQGWPPEA